MSNGKESYDHLKHQFATLVSGLIRNNGDKNKLLKILTELRIFGEKNADATTRYLMEFNAFKPLVVLLSSPNDKLLNVTLSILANSSINKDAREQIYEANVVPALMLILQHISEDSIQNRACRLAANLAISNHISERMVNEGIIPVISNIIGKHNYSRGILHSAIRAVKKIWESRHCTGKVKDHIIASGIVKNVAEGLQSDCEEIVDYILKLLLLFSSHSPSKCAQQIKLVQPDGYVLLISKLPNSTACKLMVNLCKYAHCIFYFNECHAVRPVIESLATCDKQQQTDLIFLLYVLCRNGSGGTDLLTDDKSLRTLLNLLPQTFFSVTKMQLYEVLGTFMFDPCAILRLGKLGLVETLIDILEVIIKNKGKTHLSCDLNSPESPRNICGSDEKMIYATESFRSEDIYILHILYKLLHADVVLEELSCRKTFVTVLQYLSRVRGQSNCEFAIRFLKSLVIKEQHYCNLLRYGFVLELHRVLCRPMHMNCEHCNTLRETGVIILKEAHNLSDGGLGEGQIAFKLLTEDADVKLRMALTVSYVSSDTHLLRKMLIKYKSLDILTSQLLKCKDLDSSSVEDIAYSLNELFMKLKCRIKEFNIHQSPSSTLNDHCLCNFLKSPGESTICFRMDDGSIVPGNKENLCHNSMYFNAMLCGSFKESNENEVKISDVSGKCFQLFLKLINASCECVLPDDVSLLLELVTVLDRYLFDDLAKCIMSYVMSRMISYKNCHIIFAWAKECKLPLAETITNDVIKYLFTCIICCEHLKCALMYMMYSDHNQIFINDVVCLIKSAFFDPFVATNISKKRPLVVQPENHSISQADLKDSHVEKCLKQS